MAYLISRGEITHPWELHLVDMHQQLNGAFSDLQSGHVGQEIISHKEAHEHCTSTTAPCQQATPLRVLLHTHSSVPVLAFNKG